ncbi:hypothetical protein RRG08_049715 [Elysia crispata]|uniref:Microtubule-associated protein Jupiter n=1 Tax=Elysia crispata TaxID=231223 RepID=A0AAE1DYL6_9GAST|nr:hypothetical protein RRG08_049715 [Elysia crispata]
MTTTATFQGMDQNAKPSSRVLAPPGGGSSNIFGGYEDDSQKKNARSNAQNVNKANNDIFGTGEQIATGTSPGKKHNPSNVNCGNNDIFNRESHVAPAHPKSRAPRSEFNPITGMAYEQPEKKELQAPESAQDEGEKEEGTDKVVTAAEEKPPQEQKGQQGASSGIFGGPEPTAKPHASTRVSQPPGGRSTKLW